MPNMQIISEFLSEPWAILAPHFQALLQAAATWSGEPPELEAARPAPASRQSGAIAILPLHGPIFSRGSAFEELFGPVTSAERFAAQVRQAANDPGISAMVLDVHSPGGSVAGIPEAVAALRDAAGRKPVVAAANHMAASAAYWLASSATEILVSPAGEVGSIGVFAAHQDISAALDKMGIKVSLVSAGKFKTEGNPYEPLGDDARAALQARVDEFYQMFTSDVAKGRGVAVDTVRGTFGEGRMVGAKQAVSLGMADGVGTLEDAIRRAAKLAGQAAQPVAPSAELDFRQRRARALQG